jgi:hypothetical protein
MLVLHRKPWQPKLLTRNCIEALVDPKAFVTAAETDASKLDKYKRWKR